MRPSHISIPDAVKILDVTYLEFYRLAARHKWVISKNTVTRELQVNRGEVESHQACLDTITLLETLRQRW